MNMYIFNSVCVYKHLSVQLLLCLWAFICPQENPDRRMHALTHRQITAIVATMSSSRQAGSTNML